ncbi:MAG: imidazolonepropionase [candidate division KSB1 bacterium]|nr:imidazolonepropionase [candidate division KSB1 bacterium]
MNLQPIPQNERNNTLLDVDLLIINAKQLLVPAIDHDKSRLQIIENGYVAVRDGKIARYGLMETMPDQLRTNPNSKVIDAADRIVTPGFVDAHTHPIFYGTREAEFIMRCQGKTYQEIAESGGGIRLSVRQLRAASKDQLIKHALPHLDRFLSLGTTTIEAKSGYGLSLEDEIKSLEVIQELNRLHPIDLIPTFLGAHEIPDEYRQRRDQYIDLIINEMIPLVAERNLAEFCDIFCETHVFDLKESEKILTAARDHGFKIKIHADQLTDSGGAALAAKLGAVSADHLDFITPSAIDQLKQAGTVPVLLPGAVFFLGQRQYAPARQMIDAGLPVALATDFNPGSCMTESMPMMMTLGCIYMKMLPEEAWLATTLHAAQAVDRNGKLGCLEPDAAADLVIWNIPNYQYLPYHFGVNLVDQVIKNGELVFTQQEFQLMRGII